MLLVLAWNGTNVLLDYAKDIRQRFVLILKNLLSGSWTFFFIIGLGISVILSNYFIFCIGRLHSISQRSGVEWYALRKDAGKFPVSLQLLLWLVVCSVLLSWNSDLSSFIYFLSTWSNDSKNSNFVAQHLRSILMVSGSCLLAFFFFRVITLFHQKFTIISIQILLSTV